MEPVSVQVNERRSPWVLGIILGLSLVVAANIVFVYVAVTGADPIAPSYVTEPR